MRLVHRLAVALDRLTDMAIPGLPVDTDSPVVCPVCPARLRMIPGLLREGKRPNPCEGATTKIELQENEYAQRRGACAKCPGNAGYA